MIELIETWGQWVGNFGLRALVLLSGALLVGWVFHKSWSVSRMYVLWSLFLIMLLVLPLAYLVVPAFHVSPFIPQSSLNEQFSLPLLPLEEKEREVQVSHTGGERMTIPSSQPLLQIPPAQSPMVSVGEKAEAVLEPHVMDNPMAAGPAEDSSTKQIPAGSDSVAQWSWSFGLAILWILGACAYLVSRLLGSMYLHQLEKYGYLPQREICQDIESIKKALNMKRNVTVFQSRKMVAPLTYGIFFPKILLPANIDNLTRAERKLVFYHELMHIKKWDALVVFLSQVALFFYWMNPLVWILVRKIRETREGACDDWLLAEGIDACDYASLLFKYSTASVLLKEKEWKLRGAMAMAQGENLEKRIERVVSNRVNRKRDGWIAKSTMGLVLAVIWFPLICAKVKAEIAKLNVGKDKICFPNTRTLHGELSGIKNNILFWKRPDVEEEMQIALEEITTISLGKSRDLSKQKRATLVMKNGDRLVGEIVALNPHTITLQTEFMGEIDVDRARVKGWKSPHQTAQIDYAGPRAEKEWVIRKASLSRPNLEVEGWSYQEGVLLFQGEEKEATKQVRTQRLSQINNRYFNTGSVSLQQNLPFRESFVFIVDIEKRREPWALRVDLGSLSLFFNARKLEALLSGRGKSLLWHHSPNHQKNRAELALEKVRLKIAYHFTRGEIVASANGKEIGRLKNIHEKIDPSSKGIKKDFQRNFLFNPRKISFSGKRGSVFTLQNIFLYRGKDKKEMCISGLVQKQKDQVVLTNGQILEGVLLSQRGDSWVMKMGSEEREIEKQQIKEICFLKTGPAEIERGTQLFLQEGTKMTMQLQSIDSKQVQGRVTYLELPLLTLPREALQQIAFAPSPNKKSFVGDVLTFKNGDQLIGRVSGFRQEHLLWTGGPFLEEIAIATKQVHKLQLANRERKQNQSTAYVQLTNGDVLAGEIHQWKKDSFILETSSGEPIELEREAVHKIIPRRKTAARVFYEGPQNDWEEVLRKTNSKNSWRYREGAFYAESAQTILAKRVEITEKVRIQFTVDWVEKLGLALSLFAQSTEDIAASTKYVLNLGDGMAGLVRYQQDEEKSNGYVGGKIVPFLGQLPSGVVPFEPSTVSVPEMCSPGEGEIGSATINVCVDKIQRTITLFVNERFVHTWRDSREEMLWGDVFGLVLLPENRVVGIVETPQLEKDIAALFNKPHSLRIRHLRIAPWEGENRFLLTQQAKKKRQASIFLNNGDRVEGKIVRFGERQIVVEQAEERNSLTIPQEKIAKIVWAQRKLSTTTKEQGDIHVVFRDGGKVKVELLGGKGKKIRGKNEHIGPQEFDLTGIKEIQFSPQERHLSLWDREQLLRKGEGNTIH